MPDFSLLDFDLPDLNLPLLSDPLPALQAGGSVDGPPSVALTPPPLSAHPQAEFFVPARQGPQAPWSQRLGRQAALLEAWRVLSQGPATSLAPRVALFMTLATQDGPRLSRGQIAQLCPEQAGDALDRGLRRLRASGLLAWERGQRRYLITPLARQLASLLQPWGESPAPQGPR